MTRVPKVSCLSAILAGMLALLPRAATAAEPTTPDCLRANNSSVDLQNDHKLQAARDQLLICASKSCESDIRKECLRRVDELTAAIPTMVLEAKDAASGKDLVDVKVTMDGQPFAERLDGTAIALDPGAHTFVFEAAGQVPVTQQWVIREAQKDRHESIVIGTPPPPLVSTEPKPLRFDQPALRPIETNSGLGTQRIIGLVVGGAGVVGVGIGGIFGLMAVSKKNDAQSACPNDCANQNGVDKWNDAKSTAQIADVALALGGVGLVGGAILWFTAKPRSQADTTARVDIGPGSIQLRGAW